MNLCTADFFIKSCSIEIFLNYSVQYIKQRQGGRPRETEESLSTRKSGRKVKGSSFDWLQKTPV